MAAFAPLDLSGEPRARGRAYGRALAPRIHAHLHAWLDVTGRAIGADPRAHVAAMLRDTDFKTAIAAHTPDLLAEVEGIAEGAEAPADLVFALQLLDEEWAYRLRREAAAPPLEKCSSLAIVPADGGPTWIGQNMDLGAYTDGHQALLRIAADARGPAALVFTVAGMIGLMGVNAAGVGVCVNSIPQLPSAATGVPVAFVLRRLLQARGLAEAVDLVQGLPHATNQHYVIAEPGAARSFEAGSQGVTEFRPPEPDRVLHTNHPLAEPLTPEAETAWPNSVARLKSLRGRLATGRPGFGEVVGALSAFDDAEHPVCRLADSKGYLLGFTTGSMISALSPGQVESWVSDGPPSVRPYIRTSPSAEAVA